MKYFIQSKEELTKFIHSSLTGWVCPICKRDFAPNGTGPEHSPFARKALKLLWWNKAIQRAVSIHDWRCHLGEHEYNLSFEEITAEFEKNVKEDMDAFIAKYWYRRWILQYVLYNWVDDVYAWAVSGKQGKKAFDKNGCTTPGGN
jgi:hypothetical protein